MFSRPSKGAWPAQRVLARTGYRSLILRIVTIYSWRILSVCLTSVSNFTRILMHGRSQRLSLYVRLQSRSSLLRPDPYPLPVIFRRFLMQSYVHKSSISLKKAIIFLHINLVTESIIAHRQHSFVCWTT